MAAAADQALPRAERRELACEFAFALLFLVAASVMALWLPRTRGGVGTLAWLTLICAVLARIEFEVGEGHTRPIQLVFVPMLLLLSPGLVPLGGGRGSPSRADAIKAARGRMPLRGLLLLAG